MPKRMRKESVEVVDIDWKVVAEVKNSALELVREILGQLGKSKRRKKRRKRMRRMTKKMLATQQLLRRVLGEVAGDVFKVRGRQVGKEIPDDKEYGSTNAFPCR